MIEKKTRNKAVIKLHKKGKSIRKIGEEYGIHYTTVHKIIRRKLSTDQPVGDLQRSR